MKTNTATRQQLETASIIGEILKTRLIPVSDFRAGKYKCDVSNMMGANNIFHLHDSRKIEGLYRQENGDVVVTYISWGMGQSYLITDEEYKRLRFADVKTPQNVYFEF